MVLLRVLTPRSPAGWIPSGAGAKKWGYTTSVSHGGEELTPQVAFAAYYASRKAGKAGSWAVIDALKFPNNPSCKYRTKPVAT